MLKLPSISAKIETGDSDRFTDFMRKLVQVPPSEPNLKKKKRRRELLSVLHPAVLSTGPTGSLERLGIRLLQLAGQFCVTESLP